MTAAVKTETRPAAKPAAKPAEKAAATVEPAALNDDALKSFETFADATREQFETTMKNFAGASEEWRRQTDAFGAEMRRRLERNQKRVADANAELVEAARTETADAVQFVNDLSKAKSFADALEIQRGFWTKTFDARIERARALTETAVDVARDSLAPPKTQVGSFSNADTPAKV